MVDGSDYALMDNAFNEQGPLTPTGVAAPSAAAAVASAATPAASLAVGVAGTSARSAAPLDPPLGTADRRTLAPLDGRRDLDLPALGPRPTRGTLRTTSGASRAVTAALRIARTAVGGGRAKPGAQPEDLATLVTDTVITDGGRPIHSGADS